MKIDKLIVDFIQLRIEGKSFDEIAKALKTSKSTLIEWNKKVEVRNEIKQGKALAINTVVKAFAFDRQTRLKTLLELSKKISDELLSRDLTSISTDTLLKMSIANDNRVNEIVNTTFEFGFNPSYHTAGINQAGFFKMQLDE
jgi:DNA-binding Lrp family transcriptional regulator